MRLLLCLFLLFGVSFSIPAILVEKEVTTKSNFSESHRKVKLYRADGYEKEVLEEKTTTKGNPLGQLPFLKNLPQGPQTQVNKGERITHFKEGKVITYTVNHENRTYIKREIEGKMGLMGFIMLLDCNQQGKCRPKVEPTGEKKKIGRWTARKMIVKVNMFGQMVPAYQWFTKDSRLLLEFDRLGMKNVLKAVGNDPNFSSFLRSATKALEDIRKNYGTPVMSETPVMGSTTVEVVKSVKKVNVPKSFFEVPKGYREYNPQMQMMPPQDYERYRQR